MGFFRWLWDVAKLWPVAPEGTGLRRGGRAAVLWKALFLLFCGAAFVLLVLGFDLGAVDGWLDERAGLFDLIGTVLLRIVLAIIFTVCALLAGLAVWGEVFDRKNKDRLGLGSLAVALIVGWLVAQGLFFGAI
jgi:hypothetical protein